jgi:hypothetical protein
MALIHLISDNPITGHEKVGRHEVSKNWGWTGYQVVNILYPSKKFFVKHLRRRQTSRQKRLIHFIKQDLIIFMSVYVNRFHCQAQTYVYFLLKIFVQG